VSGGCKCRSSPLQRTNSVPSNLFARSDLPLRGRGNREQGKNKGERKEKRDGRDRRDRRKHPHPTLGNKFMVLVTALTAVVGCTILLLLLLLMMMMTTTTTTTTTSPALRSYITRYTNSPTFYRPGSQFALGKHSLTDRIQSASPSPAIISRVAILITHCSGTALRQYH